MLMPRRQLTPPVSEKRLRRRRPVTPSIRAKTRVPLTQGVLCVLKVGRVPFAHKENARVRPRRRRPSRKLVNTLVLMLMIPRT